MILHTGKPYGVSLYTRAPMPLTYTEQSAKPILDRVAEWAFFELVETIFDLLF